MCISLIEKGEYRGINTKEIIEYQIIVKNNTNKRGYFTAGKEL